MNFLRVVFEGRGRAYHSVDDLIAKLSLESLSEEAREELAQCQKHNDQAYIAINPRLSSRTLVVARDRKTLNRRLAALLPAA